MNIEFNSSSKEYMANENFYKFFKDRFLFSFKK